MHINKKILKLLFQVFGLIVVIALAFYLAHFARENVWVQEIVMRYGYIGIFLVSIISGFNLLVPIPPASLIPLFLESGLLFVPTVFTIALGVTLADMIAYMLGRLGRDVAVLSLGKKIVRKLEPIKKSHPYLPLIIIFLFACFVPIPNEVILIPFAFLGYHWYHVVPVVFLGNFLFNLIYSYGFTNLFNLF